MLNKPAEENYEEQVILIARYFDGDLSDAESLEFNAQLQQDESLRCCLIEYCTRATLLRETFAPELHVASDLQFIEASTRIGQIGRPYRRRAVWGALATALALCVVIGFFTAWNGGNDVPTIQTNGSVTLIRNDGSRIVAGSLTAQPGDRFEVGGESSVSLHYRDGTKVDVSGDTTFFVDRGPSREKIVELVHGGLKATVHPQEEGRAMRFRTPTAEAEILGTQLTLLATKQTTRLDVTHGTVKLIRRSDDESVVVKKHNVGFVTESQVTSHRAVWPTDRDGIVLQMQPDGTAGFVLIGNEGRRAFPLQAVQGMSFAEQRLVLGKGKVIGDSAAEHLRIACQQTNELSIELTLEPFVIEQRGPARIVTLSHASQNYSFTIAQNYRHLVWRLHTDGNSRKPGDIGIKLYEFVDRKPHHVLISYRDGETVCRVDGEIVSRVEETTGGFSTWSPQHLVLGNEWDEGRPWKGVIEDLVIYNRFLDDNEARQNAAAYRKQQQNND